MSCESPKKYRVFAALHDDTDKGWVWLRLDSNKQRFVSRATIKIVRGKDSVYCEYRNLDANFVRKYDAEETTHSMYFGDKKAIRARSPVDLSQLDDVSVVSDWYRRALGDFKTQGFGGNPQELTICKPWRSNSRLPMPGLSPGSSMTTA